MIWSIEELHKFVNLLPDIEEGRAYILMLMIRSRLAKQLLGVKVKDIVLERKVVAWYEQRYDWRSVFVRKVKELSILAKHSNEIYVISKEKGEVPVPPEATGIVCVLNQSDVRQALCDFMNETMKLLVLQNDLENAHKVWKRYVANLHKRVKRIFHVLDLDTKDENIFNEIMSELDKYKQPYFVIETRRGYHFVIDLRVFAEDRKLAGKFFTEFVHRYVPEKQKVLYEIENGNKKPLIEYQTQAMSPVPGTVYGGFNIRIKHVSTY